MWWHSLKRPTNNKKITFFHKSIRLRLPCPIDEKAMFQTKKMSKKYPLAYRLPYLRSVWKKLFSCSWVPAFASPAHWKKHFLLKKLSDKKSLANPSSATYSNKFRAFGFIYPRKKLFLRLSAKYILFHDIYLFILFIVLIDDAKIIKKIYYWLNLATKSANRQKNSNYSIQHYVGGETWQKDCQ